MRSVGLEQVRTEAKGSEATKQFASQLTKLMPAGQIGLLSALASRGDAIVKPEVLALLKTSTDDSVRAAAIEVLVMRRALDSMPQITAMAIDPDSKVRHAAMIALAEMGNLEKPSLQWKLQ